MTIDNQGSHLSLSCLEPGDRAEVVAVLGPNAAARRMLALGFTPGTDVKLVRRAPLGDPLEFEVSGTLLALRSEEASVIAIKEVRRGQLQ